jgi:hypothetical protein
MSARAVSALLSMVPLTGCGGLWQPPRPRPASGRIAGWPRLRLWGPPVRHPVAALCLCDHRVPL